MLQRANRAEIHVLYANVLELMRSDPEFVMRIVALINARNGSAANHTGA